MYQLLLPAVARFHYIQGTDIGLIIKEGVTLNVTGIRLDTGHKLSIYTTTTDPTKFGKIVANQSHDGCSAIGGWEERMMGELVVHGVDITATGAKRAAGIGGGENGEGYMSSDVQNLIISTSKYFLPFKENIGDYEFKGWLKKDIDSSPGDIEMADGETLIALRSLQRRGAFRE